MADASDVANLLVSLITNVIYPTGTGNPSIAGVPVKVFRGWPIPDQVDTDMAAGTIDVSVFPSPTESRTTRYGDEFQPLALPVITLTATAAPNNTITIGGVAQAAVNVAAIISGVPFVYTTQTGDTLNAIATGLAALINATFSGTTSAGPVISVAGNIQVPIQAAVGGIGSVIREIKRQKKLFQLTFWCPSGLGNGPALRDAIVPPVDAFLGDQEWLNLADGTGGRILYERNLEIDMMQKELIYRRDLFYSVEYGTTQTQNIAQIVAGIFNLSGGLDPSNPLFKTFAN